MTSYELLYQAVPEAGRSLDFHLSKIIDSFFCLSQFELSFLSLQPISLTSKGLLSINSISKRGCVNVGQDGRHKGKGRTTGY